MRPECGELREAQRLQLELLGAPFYLFIYFFNLALTSSLLEQGSAWRSPERPVLWSNFERPSFGASGGQGLAF